MTSAPKSLAELSEIPARDYTEADRLQMLWLIKLGHPVAYWSDTYGKWVIFQQQRNAIAAINNARAYFNLRIKILDHGQTEIISGAI